MIVNFITDEYLERFYPDLVNYRMGGQNDYARPINAAVERVLDDLVARNVKPRNCMVPIDLNGLAGRQQLTLLSTDDLTFIADKYYSPLKLGTNQRRAYLDVTQIDAADSWRWILVGSNMDAAPSDTSDASCEDVLTFEYLANSVPSSQNRTFVEAYKPYGSRLERVAGVGDLRFKSADYETVYDMLIAYKAIALISASWKTGLNEKWDERKDDMQKEYEARLETIRINLDSNEDGVPEEAEQGKKVGATIGSISLLG